MAPKVHFLNPVFTICYLVLFSAMIALELFGVTKVHNGVGKGETITENWRWVDQHIHGAPRWLLHIFTGGFLVWLLLHFLVGIA